MSDLPFKKDYGVPLSSTTAAKWAQRIQDAIKTASSFF